MSGKYWETEKPFEVDTGKNVFRYFKEAGKLQVSMPHWVDNSGAQKPGKTITLDVGAIKATPGAVEILKEIAK